MNKIQFGILCFALILLSSACSLTGRQMHNSSTESAAQVDDEFTQAILSTGEAYDDAVIISGWGPHMFDGLYNTNSELTDQIVELFIAALEDRDDNALKQLFAENIIINENVDEQISSLYEFYKGEMTSYERSGLYTSESKESSLHVKHIMVAYNISTTDYEYRLAFKLCTVDTGDVGNQGICSLYIAKATTINSELVYWGGHVWDSGIRIEE